MNRLIFYKGHEKTIESYHVQVRYFLDVVLPAYRDSIQKAQMEYSYYVNEHYFKFWNGSKIELLKVYKIFIPMEKYVRKIYDEFSIHMIDTDGQLYEDEFTHNFEKLLIETIQLLDELKVHIEADVMGIEKHLEEGVKGENHIS